jgi:hypothetical protein
MKPIHYFLNCLSYIHLVTYNRNNNYINITFKRKVYRDVLRLNVIMKQRIVNVFGETEVEETCCNYTCRHGLSDHIGRYHSKCKCNTFKSSGATKK